MTDRYGFYVQIIALIFCIGSCLGGCSQGENEQKLKEQALAMREQRIVHKDRGKSHDDRLRREIEHDISILRTRILEKPIEAETYGASIKLKITQLSQMEMRESLLNYFSDELCSISLLDLSYQDQERVLRAFEDIHNRLSLPGWRKSKRLLLRLNFIARLRREVLRLGNKLLPEGVFVLRFSPEVEQMMAHDGFLGCRQTAYESAVNTFERYSMRDLEKTSTSEEIEQVHQKFLKIVGRPVRTQEEIDAQWRKKSDELSKRKQREIEKLGPSDIKIKSDL